MYRLQVTVEYKEETDGSVSAARVHSVAVGRPPTPREPRSPPRREPRSGTAALLLSGGIGRGVVEAAAERSRWVHCFDGPLGKTTPEPGTLTRRLG